jgi:hypothetical protein
MTRLMGKSFRPLSLGESKTTGSVLCGAWMYPISISSWGRKWKEASARATHVLHPVTGWGTAAPVHPCDWSKSLCDTVHSWETTDGPILPEAGVEATETCPQGPPSSSERARLAGSEHLVLGVLRGLRWRRRCPGGRTAELSPGE